MGYKVLVHTEGRTCERMLREGGELVIGREPELAIALLDGNVSRRHAELRMKTGELEVLDLGSRNGTLVDGERIAAHTPTPIRATSVVRIGRAVLVFERVRAGGDRAWCFDRASFLGRAEALLQNTNNVGLIEIAWDRREVGSRTTTAAEAGAPTGVHQVLSRLIESRGVGAAYEAHRLMLVLPDTSVTHLDEVARLVQRQCEEEQVRAEVRFALSQGERTLDALLARCAPHARSSLAPAVQFRGTTLDLERLLPKLDASDSPILVLGETGVGKDVLARTLHAHSKRASKPYIALNCAAFAETLFESELFGHERGAFTGAQRAKTGILESAAGGTVFFDEIGEMPLGLQAKLLRVVENREMMRIGGLTPIPINLRFVFATNRDLHEEIENKTFRGDLFYRISSVTLTIPPLRERQADIEPLALHFIEQACQRVGRNLPRLLPETVRYLQEHAWPGNVRELKNAVDLAVLVLEGDELTPADMLIERYVPRHGTARQAAPVEVEISEDTTQAPSPEAAQSERERIQAALVQTAGNQSAAAKLLGMPRRTLVKRLGEYDFPRPRKS